MKVKEGILVHASKILDPEFQVVNQNKSKVMMPASFLNNQSAGTVREITLGGVPTGRGRGRLRMLPVQDGEMAGEI